MSDLVKIARARVTDIQQTHWEGCERDHRECLIQRMADEIERLRQWELVGREWINKTDWMQSRDAPVRWLGKHRADALREEIERLTAERDELRRQLAEAEPDARRYRWLRDQQAGEVDDYGTVGIKFRCDFEHYRDLDAAIDAEMGLTRPAEE